MSRRRRGKSAAAAAQEFWGASPGSNAGAPPDSNTVPGTTPDADGGHGGEPWSADLERRGEPRSADPERGSAPFPGPGLAAPHQERPRVRPAADPAGMVRSLGPPPLAVNQAVAVGSLAATYEEAVRAASALAASCGILDRGAPERR
ncbi:MAG: hypothetical protein ACRD0J_15605 [Acidimicrobiales bacterium]